MGNNRKDPGRGKRSYSSDLSRAERNCRRDIIVSLVMLILFSAAAAWFFTGYKLPAALAAYRYALCSAALSGVLFSLVRALSGLSERKSCREIIRDSVYAVRLSSDQQKLISRTLARQSAKEHFLCYSAVLLILSVILILSYIKSGNKSSLVVLSAAALAGLCAALLSYVRDVVRTASGDGFCTVSGKGIIQAGRVIPFRAANGDVLEMIMFDDCYAVRFVTGGVLGLMVRTDFPLPKRGSVSRTLIGAEEEPVLLSALRPGKVSSVEGGYRQLPFEREPAVPEDDAAAVPDESSFLRFAAYAAAAILAVSSVLRFTR